MAATSTPKALANKPARAPRTRKRSDAKTAGLATLWTQLPLDLGPVAHGMAMGTIAREAAIGDIAHAMATGTMPGAAEPQRGKPAGVAPSAVVPGALAGLLAKAPHRATGHAPAGPAREARLDLSIGHISTVKV